MAAAAYGDKQIVTFKDLDPKYLYELVNRQQITVVECPPFFGKQLLVSADVKPMESVKLVIVLGSTFSAKFIKELERIFPNAKIGSCYGCTEGDVLVFTREIGKKGTTSGTPCPNVRLKVRLELSKSRFKSRFSLNVLT
jgi:acyl-CoA synthetase (AMP-forming)/AMP-acid ligase II